MSTQTAKSLISKTPVGKSGKPLFSYTETSWQTDDSGKIIADSAKTTLYVSKETNPVLAMSGVGYVPAATSTNSLKSFTLLKDSNNNFILGSDAQSSLNKGALKTTTSQSVSDILSKANVPKTEQAKINKATANQTSGQDVEKVDLTDSNNSLFGTGEVLGGTEGLPGKGAPPLKYPLDISPQQDYIEFRMIEYSPRPLGDTTPISGTASNTGATNIAGIGDRRNPQTAESKGTVILPIQSGITDSNSTGWGNGDISPLDAFLAKDFLVGLKDGISNSIDQMQKQTEASTSPQNKGAVQTAIAAVFASAAINKPDVLSRTTGAIINPNTELLFQGVSLRPFSFTFRMSARNKDEANVIKRIIFFFKKGMSAKRTKQGLFLKAPNTFMITYKHGNSEHKAINKIKECALLSCSVNYIPDGYYASHADGNLTAYELTLQFNELEPIFYDNYTGTDDVGY
jgi:hypothetical protein